MKKTLKKAIKNYYITEVGLGVDRTLPPQRIIDKAEMLAEKFTEKNFGDFICCEHMKETLKHVLTNIYLAELALEIGVMKE